MQEQLFIRKKEGEGPKIIRDLPFGELWWTAAQNTTEAALNQWPSVLTDLLDHEGILDITLGVAFAIGEICRQVFQAEPSLAVEELFTKYPGLSRQIKKFRNKWEQTLLECLERYNVDQEKIAKTFFKGENPGKISKGLCQLAWFKQERTAVLHFSSGKRLVYKRRSVRAEELYNSFIESLSSEGLSPDLKGFQTLTFANHGWAEFVTHSPVLSDDEANSYFQRIGLLLRIWELLAVTDCIGKNIIAHGAYPIFIDGETLFTFLTPKGKSNWKRDRYWVGSVLRSGALPRPSHSLEHLGRVMIPRLFFLGEEYEFCDEENSFLWSCITPSASKSHFVYNKEGKVYNACHSAAYLLESYREAYHWFQERPYLLLNNPLVEEMTKQPMRRSVRSSTIYHNFYHTVHSPEFMKEVEPPIEKAERQFVSEYFHFDYFENSQLPQELFKYEVRTMFNEEAPIFYGNLQSDIIKSDDGHAFKGWNPHALRRMELLIKESSEEDLQIQEKLIRVAFLCPILPEKVNSWRSAIEESPKRSLNDIIENIACQLESAAISDDDGNWCWITLESGYRADHWVYGPIRFSLGTGVIGIALFFAALAKSTDSERWWSAYRKTIRSLIPVLQLLGSKPHLWHEEGHPLGCWDGFVGIIYGLMNLSIMTADPSLEKVALHFLQNLSHQLFYEMEDLSFANGLAGIGVVLAYFRNRFALEQYTPIISNIEERLLKTLRGSSAPWTHGLASSLFGMLYALSKISGKKIFSQRELLGRIFIEREKIQPLDLSITEGLAGTALSLAACDLLGSDLNSSLIHQLCDHKITSSDSLGFGNMGRLHALHALSDSYTLGGDLFLSISRNIFTVTPQYPDIQILGFLQGLAGVGYSLLRIQNGALPDILLLNFAR